MHLTGFLPIVLLLFIVSCAGRPFYPLPGKLPDGDKQPLQTSHPYNIAHRGSNGELPEETAPAYLVINKAYKFLYYFPIWEISQLMVRGKDPRPNFAKVKNLYVILIISAYWPTRVKKIYYRNLSSFFVPRKMKMRCKSWSVFYSFFYNTIIFFIFIFF